MASMKPEQRQERLAEFVLGKGTATAQELAPMFGVSLMTIHRDLDELAARGVVRKFRGGVTAQPSGVFESNVAYRRKAMLTEKRAIVRVAARHVEPGMSLILDDATTTYHLIAHLERLRPLHVATNFLPAMRELATLRDVGLTGLGGTYDPLHDSFLGVMCVEAVELLRVDAAFVSTSALAGGFAYHQEERIVGVKRAMLEAADRRYLLLDHSKLGRRALHRLVPVSAFDLVIVDAGADEAALAELDRDNVRYEVAEL
ncbi:DeoR/GlpR family DNA-binding transcription regulator [Actinopolymorpha alba]|uniref:DeoR/GlpR family DNA-binding transcription regulator n=1 Tax=Actinopolymorpha alba TaxID=533267 RepID=UPI00035F9770|nr:DeoR/GlpR family DNA-binding transcription regulator [Actinopolymorpha alba]